MPLALCLVWAAPARADTAVPQPAAKKTWRDGCAARIDAAASLEGMPPRARAKVIPLRQENGKPNPVEYVEYVTPNLAVTAGDDAERHPDEQWTVTVGLNGHRGFFRRLHGRFGKIEDDGQRTEDHFKKALDDCLQMGEAK